MSKQTTDPHFIDINLATSLDLQIHMSDYIDLITDLTDEVTTNLNYWHRFSHSDPTTSKTNFYKDLNNKTLKLKDSNDGTVKRDVTSDKLMNKNYRDQLPDNMQIATSSGNKYSKPTLESGGTMVAASRNVKTRYWKGDKDIQSTGEWVIETKSENTSAKVTPVLDIQKSPPSPSDVFGMKDMSAWFKMWWIEKFNTSHSVIKSDLIELLGDDNEFFVEFSESVGQLKNIADTYDTSTLPVWDVNVSSYGDTYSIPSTTAGVAKYCMKPESIVFSDQISKQTNMVYRKNLSNMMEDPSRDSLITGTLPSFPGNSHGNNFVNDMQHFSRMYQNAETVDSAIRDHLKGLYDVLTLLSDRENYMIVNKPKQIMLKVEDFTISVDMFKNRIKSSLLDDDNITSSRYGKYVKYNTYKSNDTLG